MRAKRLEAPHCNIQEHVPAANHKAQLEAKNQRIDELQAELDAVKAKLGWAAARETGRILNELAAAFRVGEEAGWPAAASQHYDNDRVTTGKVSASKQPTGGNRGARSATFILQRKVEEAIDSFNTKKDNNWSSPYQLTEFECEQCGSLFEAKRKDARYCSDACRQTASRVTDRVTDNGKTSKSHGLVESA